MQHEPPVSQSPWPQSNYGRRLAWPHMAIAIEIDRIRLARLLIFFALIGFWGAVFMAIF